MSIDVNSKASRRQIADEFKERKVPQGIYAVRCIASGEAWVGSSTNLNAAQNSLWFQLRGGLSRHAALQAAWKQHAEQAFVLEVMEQVDEDISPLLLPDTLRARKHYWANTLNASSL